MTISFYFILYLSIFWALTMYILYLGKLRLLDFKLAGFKASPVSWR